MKEQTINAFRKRVFSNWKSSLIGIVILVVASAALLIGRASLTEFTALLPVVVGLFWVRDTFFKLDPK
jgi:hypothetical protein